MTEVLTATVTIYEKIVNSNGTLRFLGSINTTTIYKGWLDFNITLTLDRWLLRRSNQQNLLNELVVGVNINVYSNAYSHDTIQVLPSDIGLVKPGMPNELLHLQPFLIGYFEGPELITKIQKLRSKRDVIRHKRETDPSETSPVDELELPKNCELLNFTFDFKDLQMQKWVIAPRKFEAYFCGGQCNFPLGSRMNATNHAIVQTLMHLKDPDLPKACCVPTQLGSISILHYLSEDSVNLSIYPQSVAKECGCH